MLIYPVFASWIPALSWCRDLSNSSHEPCYAGSPKQTDHSEEFWQNVLHWRRKCNPLQYSCHENPLNNITKEPGVLQSMVPQGVGHDLATKQQQHAQFYNLLFALHFSHLNYMTFSWLPCLLLGWVNIFYYSFLFLYFLLWYSIFLFFSVDSLDMTANIFNLELTNITSFMSHTCYYFRTL